MASQGTFSPTGLAMFRDRLFLYGFDPSLDYVGGENVVHHTSVEGIDETTWTYEDPDEPGTFPMRDRIANCEFTLVGIGIAADLEGTYWGTESFFVP